jgi:hypothetical protein
MAYENDDAIRRMIDGPWGRQTTRQIKESLVGMAVKANEMAVLALPDFIISDGGFGPVEGAFGHVR